MEFLDHIPALIRIFLVLGIVISGLKFKIPLSYSLLIGGVFLGVFFHMPMGDFFAALKEGTFSIDTLSLVVIVTGILILSNGMSASGRLERIVNSFKELVGESRITLVTFPALIGLLPMPGGAVFSAPMVGAMSDNTDLPQHHKTIINYWFRHIWEYWFPLYPGVILAITLTNIPAWKFMLLNLPMTFVVLGVGYLIILRKVKLSEKVHRNYSGKNIRKFISQLMPILLMVFTLLILGISINIIEKQFGFKSKILERIPILIGLAFSFAWVVIADKFKNIKSVVFKKSIWDLGLLVLGIMIFKSILEMSGGVDVLKNELITYNIPIAATVMLLPFITGIITGIAVGFVGTAFPLLITLVATMADTEHSGAYYFIAYVFGFSGMMLSPVHLCLLLTKDYFKADLIDVYKKYLITLSTITCAIALVIYCVYRYFNL